MKWILSQFFLLQKTKQQNVFHPLPDTIISFYHKNIDSLTFLGFSNRFFISELSHFWEWRITAAEFVLFLKTFVFLRTIFYRLCFVVYLYTEQFGIHVKTGLKTSLSLLNICYIRSFYINELCLNKYDQVHP